MGNKVESISPSWLPVPSEEVKKILEEKGIIFYSLMKSSNGLVRTELPFGWGLFQVKPNYYYLLDERKVLIAYISHVIELCKYWRQFSSVKLIYQDGWYIKC